MSDEFRFGLGDPVLEFVATLAGRRREPKERLQVPEDLSRWLEAAGLATNVRCNRALLSQARELREAIYRTIDAGRAQRPPSRRDIEIINRHARRATPIPQLTPQLGLTWTRQDSAGAALARLAADAIELLSGSDLTRVRNCASPTCSLLFIDRSRPGRRRWCSMERCGNRDKTARYREHRRATDDRGRSIARFDGTRSEAAGYGVPREPSPSD